MVKAAIIESGVVVNLAESEADFAALKGWIISDIAQVGWTFDGTEFHPPVVALADLKAAATARASAKRNELINGGMTFQNVRYQTRPGDRENIMGASTAALGAIVNGAQVGDLRWHGGDTDFTWIAEDNSETPMDAHTIYAFGQAAMAHKQAIIFHARFLKDAVATADTQQELDAVNIETGWPGQ